jgi:hypothetical protein
MHRRQTWEGSWQGVHGKEQIMKHCNEDRKSWLICSRPCELRNDHTAGLGLDTA